MRRNSLVKHMQRIPHVHRSAKRNVMINGRYVCDECPFRWPRRKSPGTKREMYDFESERLLIALLPKKTNDELRAMILKRDKNAKNLGKMKKAELVHHLVYKILKQDSSIDPALIALGHNA